LAQFYCLLDTAYGTEAQIAYTMIISDAFSGCALFFALTLQSVKPLNIELKICMSDASARLPAGTVVL